MLIMLDNVIKSQRFNDHSALDGFQHVENDMSASVPDCDGDITTRSRPPNVAVLLRPFDPPLLCFLPPSTTVV